MWRMIKALLAILWTLRNHPWESLRFILANRLYPHPTRCLSGEDDFPDLTAALVDGLKHPAFNTAMEVTRKG